MGVWTALVGALWGIVAYFGVRPLFTEAHAGAGQLSPLGYAEFYFGQRFDDLATSWLLRLATAFAVLGPVLPIALYAIDWTVLAMAVALPVLLSSGPGPSYLYGGHHYAVVVPFLASAVVWGTVRLQIRAQEYERSGRLGSRPVTWSIALGAALVMTILANIGLVNTPLSPRYRSVAPEAGLLGWAYSRSSRDALKDRWLDEQVPDEAPVLASMMLATHLTNRHELHIAIPLDGTSPHLWRVCSTRRSMWFWMVCWITLSPVGPGLWSARLGMIGPCWLRCLAIPRSV